MGQFALVISGMGGHGCERGVKDGEHVLGCQRPDCPDCIGREMVRRLRRNGVQELQAELVHWPAAIAVDEDGAVDPDLADVSMRVVAKYAIVQPQGSSVVDNLVTGVRSGSF